MRETSSVTTRAVLSHVHDLGGDSAVHAVLARADLPDSPQQLNDPAHWVSYDSRIRLFEAAAGLCGGPEVLYDAGRSSMRRSVAPSVVLAMRSMGSPADIYALLPQTIGKYSTTSTMELVESTATSAVFRFWLHEGYEHSRLDCLYAQGLVASIPEAFDLPPARIEHEECESDGAAACVYRVSWESNGGVGSDLQTALAMENAALRRQLDDLRSATADLVSGDDLAAVLQRVVERAATAVVARAYLLVVRADDGPLQVHSHGLSPAEVPPLSEALLAGEDLGPTAVVVEIVSTHRHHGWLAALHCQTIRGDRAALRGYAGHAAAALDTVNALAASRREARRVTALLELAHRLVDAERPQAVADVVSDTLTAAVGCDSASVMLWKEQEQVLRPVSSAGKSAAAVQVLRGLTVSPRDVPELDELLLHGQPRIARLTDASPPLAALMRATEVEHLLVVPMLAGGRFYGVITGSWGELPCTGDTESDLMQRLRGVAHQAATALRNAELTADVRHQAEHDELTALPNRRLFLRRLTETLAGASSGCTGVLFCDLDGFKQVNDAYGHAVGDQLLRQVAGRISSAVRAEDEAGRLSGDEFAILLPGLPCAAEAQQVAQRVVDALRAPFEVEGVRLRVTASVGLALHTGPDGDPDRLLREADQAMYVGKQHGRDQVVRFSPAPRPRSAAQTAIAAG